MSFAKLPVLRHGLMLRHEEILPDTAVTERVQIVRKLMQREGLEGLLLFSDAANNGPVCYLTNYPCFGLGRRAVAVLSLNEGPFLYTAEPSRNLPRVRRFTSCDLEKMRRFLPGAVERIKVLSQGGRVGLVGFTNLPVGLLKDIEKDLSGLNSKDVSQDFAILLAGKDESSLEATKRALEMAGQGIKLLSEQCSAEKDLWQMAAYVDYRLRLLGCEDTNILLGCTAGGRVRPGYPSRISPRPGNTVVAYIAAQYARHWGVAGRTFTMGPTPTKLEHVLAKLEAAQNRVARQISTGMTVGQVEAMILDAGNQAGVPLAQDLPIAAGTGFDLSEYPDRTNDRIGINTVLQVTLASDVDEFSAMRTDMLHVTQSGGSWLKSGNG